MVLVLRVLARDVVASTHVRAFSRAAAHPHSLYPANGARPKPHFIWIGNAPACGRDRPKI